MESMEFSWLELTNPFEVLPMEDLWPHRGGPDCWCRPEMNDDDCLVHYAWDRREDFEEGRRRPS